MESIEKKNNRVLIAPLDWGLGHATRMIPIVYGLQKLGCEVELASDSLAYDLLKKEFPDLKIYRIPAYSIRYTRNQFLMLSLVIQSPRMLRGMIKEHNWLKSYVERENPDLIISDDRFGMYHSNVKSCYVTHQIRVIMPLYLKVLQPIARFLHKFIIKKYDVCLVPDNKCNSLSGILSHRKRKFPYPIMYLGILSRYADVQKRNILQIPDVLIIISGPEPQRGILQNKLLDVYRNSSSKVLMVAGLPNKTNSYQDGSVQVVSHMDREKLSEIMQNVKVLICRSGYSSLMDLFKIKRKAILIPTPGQTEQVYLAKYFKEEYSFDICKQSDISNELQFASDNCGVWNYSGLSETKTLEESLKELLYSL